jgi:2,3,4,5-tetrahydropyridine-2,6-dicarboxylate N-succinyltransferase
MTTEGTPADLRKAIETIGAQQPLKDREAARAAVARLFRALERGEVRSAEKGPGGWEAVEWVKKGILLAFRAGETAPYPTSGPKGTLPFFDRDTLPLRNTKGVEEKVRIVPGGSSVRAGAYLGPNVVIMPPAYVNVGAWVGEGTMVDSHALVGSCAQIGARVHLSAGVQVGGVLEPVGLRPVIIEDDAMIGANSGIFEGVLVGEGAVLAPGVQLTAATALVDLVRGEIHRSSPGSPLAVPPGAVVVPGSRPARGEFAESQGIHLYAPVIVKYRDEKTDAATLLEDALR